MTILTNGRNNSKSQVYLDELLAKNFKNAWK